MNKTIFKKNLLHNIHKSLITALFITVILGSSGCKTSMEVEAGNPNFIEREGWAFSRLITSPISVLGPTAATYGHIYTDENWHPVESILITPFVPILTIPAGTAVTCTNVFIGIIEMLTTLHFHRISFPFESYNYQNAKWWNYGTALTFICLCAGATANPALAMLAITNIPEPSSGIRPISNPHVAAAVSNQLAASTSMQPIISAPANNSYRAPTSKVSYRQNYKQPTKIYRPKSNTQAYYTCSKHPSNRIAVGKTCALCTSELLAPRAPRFAN